MLMKCEQDMHIYFRKPSGAAAVSVPMHYPKKVIQFNEQVILFNADTSGC